LLQSVYGGRADVDQLLSPVEQFLLSDRTAILHHAPALPVRKFLAHLKQVIDLTIDDDKNDDDDHITNFVPRVILAACFVLVA
jgi:hypothetical protein